jgi:hypothetical protein
VRALVAARLAPTAVYLYAPVTRYVRCSTRVLCSEAASTTPRSISRSKSTDRSQATPAERRRCASPGLSEAALWDTHAERSQPTSRSLLLTVRVTAPRALPALQIHELRTTQSWPRVASGWRPSRPRPVEGADLVLEDGSATLRHLRGTVRGGQADGPAHIGSGTSSLPSWPCRFDPGHPLHALTGSYARLSRSAGHRRCIRALVMPTPVDR